MRECLQEILGSPSPGIREVVGRQARDVRECVPQGEVLVDVPIVSKSLWDDVLELWRLGELFERGWMRSVVTRA